MKLLGVLSNSLWLLMRLVIFERGLRAYLLHWQTISHFQEADKTVTFIETDLLVFSTLKASVSSFEPVSGLKVNWGKLRLFGSESHLVLGWFFCWYPAVCGRIGFLYQGLPLGVTLSGLAFSSSWLIGLGKDWIHGRMISPQSGGEYHLVEPPWQTCLYTFSLHHYQSLLSQ